MRMYFINSNKDVPSPVSRSWRSAMMEDETKCCPMGCSGVVPSFCPTPIDVPLDRGTDETIIGCVMVNIIHHSLFEIVSPFLDGHIAGRCVAAGTGKIIESHVTLYALPGKGIMVDGEDPASTLYFQCPVCGDRDAQYSPKYVIRRKDLAGRRASLAGRHDALTVDEGLMRQIKSKNFKNIHISSVPVVD